MVPVHHHRELCKNPVFFFGDVKVYSPAESLYNLSTGVLGQD